MPKIIAFPWDETLALTSVAHMLYPKDEKRRRHWYATNLISKHAPGLGFLSKIEKHKKNPGEKLEFTVWKGEEERLFEDLKWLINDVPLEHIQRCEKEIISYIKEVDGYEVVDSPRNIKLDIDRSVFRWIALGMVVRLIAEFSFLHKQKICKKKPSKLGIWQLGQKYEPLRRTLHCCDIKTLEQWWVDGKPSLHFYATLSVIAIPRFEYMSDLYNNGYLGGKTGEVKGSPLQWRKHIFMEQLGKMDFSHFISMAKAYQAFGLSYKPRKTKTPLFHRGMLYTIPKECNVSKYNIENQLSIPDHLIDLYNKI